MASSASVSIPSARLIAPARLARLAYAQVLQADVRGAGVVQGDPHTERAQVVDHLGEEVVVVHGGVLGDVQDEAFRRDSGSELAEGSRGCRGRRHVDGEEGVIWEPLQ